LPDRNTRNRINVRMKLNKVRRANLCAVYR
jgi:hypothetical protein